MSGKFVRASKYRHVFGQAAKRELQYENIKVTNNAWDSNILKTNGKYISVNWNASGGGAFAVIPVGEVGKSPDQVPLFRGHTAQVLDTDFDPFHPQRIVSCSDDAKICVWEIPEDYSFHKYVDENGDPKDIKPVKILSGHSRKVGHVLFHPVAENILVSSSLDYTVRLWNIETGENVITLKHPDMVTSMSFSYNGEHLATISRDKKLRVWNIKKQEIISEGAAHTGAKNQRVVWLGNSDRLATTGFSKLSDRQIGIWDAFNLEKGDLGGFYNIDQSSGILMPFFDDSNKILYLAGKGDGNIRYYEFQNDELFELSEFQSTEPQRGFAMIPKRLVNVKENEVFGCFKTVVDQRIEYVSFRVPRRAEEFQDDIYPDAPSDKPALSAEEWLSGKEVDGPILVSMRAAYDDSTPIFHPAEKQSTPEPTTPTPVTKEQSPIVTEKEVVKEEPKKETVVPKASSPAPKTGGSLDDLKEDDSVSKLLKKSSDLDTINDAEDPSKAESTWDDEDDKPTVIKTPSPSSSPKVQTPEQKIEKPVVKTEIKKSEENPVKKETKEETKQAETTSEPTKSSSTATAGPKSLGLKQSVEKLSSLVLHLEDVIKHLAEANLQKDERLKAVEKKLEELVHKN
ncbi:similar to Saccharomyces cerevisiae YLR429W CRN1 Coronin, cortical actin cytoskeletal component that associates with the Arp2p/Arp3p complex to regulate its activity [Maudiozyma saulgeensis]|uniref:Coronin n=1 Tax=Maudiozyma saulgeensis TaxID=1789683 RepID=A0A1X7R922_9SACH|nr:similar to Saccharomyces cerevisiae YLR429W CRN1 Coronin, cortical actin cytoskeletal component that associates with the Arp2p/Arp3p complex to regulate its activity [Kazachstania saulgeensis]